MYRTWLLDIRKERHVTQKFISEQVGIAQPSYFNIEAGKRRPSVSVAKKIAAVLGFDWTRFYEEDDEGQGSV